MLLWALDLAWGANLGTWVELAAGCYTDPDSWSITMEPSS